MTALPKEKAIKATAEQSNYLLELAVAFYFQHIRLLYVANKENLVIIYFLEFQRLGFLNILCKFSLYILFQFINLEIKH